MYIVIPWLSFGGPRKRLDVNWLGLYIVFQMGGTSTTRHDTIKHGTIRHGGSAVPCRVVPPCLDSGPGTTLKPSGSVVSCHKARQPQRTSVVPWYKNHITTSKDQN